MRSTRLLLVALSLTFSSGLVLYATQARGECTNAHELDTGAPAPCQGVLFPRAWALQAVSCVQLDLPRAEAERNAAAIAEADCQQTLASLQKAYELHLEKYEELVRDAAGLRVEPWHKSPIFWFGVGVVGGAGFAVLVR